MRCGTTVLRRASPWDGMNEDRRMTAANGWLIGSIGSSSRGTSAKHSGYVMPFLLAAACLGGTHRVCQRGRAHVLPHGLSCLPRTFRITRLLTSSDTSDAQASTGTGWPSIYAHEGDPPTHAPPAQRTMQAWFSNALTAKRASPHGRPRRSADGKGEGQALS